MKILLQAAKRALLATILIVAFLLFWIYMIPGALLGIFAGKKCPEWSVYGLGVVLAVLYRLVFDVWYLRLGDATIISVVGIVVCILNLILAYSFVWSGFRISIVLTQRSKKFAEQGGASDR